ncbi:putative NADH-dependent flavin oxidoreductase YqiG [Nocardioides psychrotolerans]|uniref:NADH:flavin oxidoreductase n=1 Tax=Nocardioides psychrotolerans TaxID=1005945 RepID=UPI000B828B81|nr:NADH:flavin oxidoreductase [Nocardioides psychrotolerans]GEP40575.1 putative NADH-dependent flavin oxidoreductase YqiG [Nocardioides psychrotolerans]
MTSTSDPLQLPHGPAWANRFALAPLTNTQSNADGTLSDDEHDWLVARGRGGFGLVMTCAAYVDPAGQAWQGQLGIASDEHLPGLTRLADSLRATGARSAVQLHHGGRRADSDLTGRPLQAPWDDPKTGAVALSTSGVKAMVDSFVGAAVRAETAGFDGVQVHGAHGYLIGQFLDPRHERTDCYGGSLENRMRPMTEVLHGIRAATGPDFQVGLRLSPEGFGVTVAEGVETTRQVLASELLDHLDLSLWDVFMKPRREAGEGLLIDHFTDLPRHSTRLGVAGLVQSAADAAWCLDKGADLVTIGTGAILHHDFATRAIADPDFRVRQRPVSRDILRAEHVGPAFIDYLAAGWDDLVA